MITKEYEFYGVQTFSYKPKYPWLADRIGLCVCNCQATQEGMELTLDVNDWCNYCHDLDYNLSESYRIQSMYDNDDKFENFNFSD